VQQGGERRIWRVLGAVPAPTGRLSHGRLPRCTCAASHTGTVEVAPAAAGVLLRDTKDKGAGPVIAFTPEQWTAFLAEVVAGAPASNGVVEVIQTDDGTQVHCVATGVRLRFTPSEWVAFRAGVGDGEFSLRAPA
jgi:uncharacterized protein DUF397